MNPALIAEAVSFLIQEEPAIQQGIVDIIAAIKSARDKTVTAEKAQDAMNAAVGLMLGRLANPAAESDGVNAAIDQALDQKFKP